MRFPPLTIALICVSVILGLASGFGSRPAVFAPFLISSQPHALPEVAAGEVWRFLTPIFIHGSLLHLAFNMLWLWELGGAVERRQGTWQFALLVCVLAATSNLAQFYLVHPWFGGMSGVVYGLFGYVWIQGRLNRRFGMGLHKPIVLMMLGWFVICWLGVVGNVANIAHTVGLVVGALGGFLGARLGWPD